MGSGVAISAAIGGVTLLIVMLMLGALAVAMFVRKKPAMQATQQIAHPAQLTLEQRGVNWLYGLDEAGMEGAAKEIANRYARYKTGEITKALSSGEPRKRQRNLQFPHEPQYPVYQQQPFPGQGNSRPASPVDPRDQEELFRK